MLQVVEHACELAETSFGNYVIQSCLALCSDKDRYASCAPSHARLISLLLFMSSFILREWAGIMKTNWPLVFPECTSPCLEQCPGRSEIDLHLVITNHTAVQVRGPFHARCLLNPAKQHLDVD